MVYCFAFVAALSCGFALQSPTMMSLSSSSSPPSSSSSSSSTLLVRPIRSLAETLSAKRWQGQTIQQRTASMKERTAAMVPLTADEVEDVLFSIQNLARHTVDYPALREVLQTTAHVSHKDWSVTETNGQRLAQVLLPPDGMITDQVRPLLERILTQGHWDDAVQHAAAANQMNRTSSSSSSSSWAVLVTGVNGIRKTTSLYQDWWPQLLQQALVVPPLSLSPTLDELPSGRNSFFRQLDHMIATLCNEDFGILYQLTADYMEKTKHTADDALAAYAELKAAIFGRYRTLSELLGAALLQQAQSNQANCLMETSGRDVAMFHYVNHFFGNNNNNNNNNNNGQYKKLALHFTINNLRHACDSVDRRMQGELQTGLAALAEASAKAVVHANAGGPYGSAVLADVQAASDAVWENDILPNDSAVAADWYKATIQINAHATKPWTAQAVRPDGSLGTEFTFVPKES